MTPAQWLAAQGKQPFAFQREVWRAIAAGESGLLHASTGAGKTWAVWLGLLAHLAGRPAKPTQSAQTAPDAPPLTVLWLTPMRALAADTHAALRAPLANLAPHWTAGLRTGDTAAGARAAQNRRLPTLLVTTPESLSLLLARADAREQLGRVAAVVVDEWHELLGNKRGVQTQLALARLATWQPALQVWGLSATLGHLADALRALLPAPLSGRLVQGAADKHIEMTTLLPARIERFGWAGHLGLSMLPRVAEVIATSRSVLVFTNTRSQAERWYQALLDHRPDWAGQLALHHGSLDATVRQWVEHGLKSGQLRAVVCTSSLDLGVDFAPVDRVVQIGSPKGVGRLMQRAGRSGHAPGLSAQLTFVPTHSLEVVDAAALRRLLAARRVEPRPAPDAPLDVLVQHLVTLALGGGFTPDALFDEVRRAASYAAQPRAQFDWALAFVQRGGAALAAYPDFQRVVPDAQGVWRVPDARLARRHRANIGTIVADAAVSVQFVGGARLGSVEESFVARLKPGDAFTFAGRTLELVRLHQMTAQVKLAAPGRASVPRWAGGRMPLSGLVSDALLAVLAEADAGRFDGPEMACAQPLLALQARVSALPTPTRLVAETLTNRDGHHLFVYPLAGHAVHLALAALLAWRVAREQPATFSIAVAEHGFALLSATPVDWPALLPRMLAPLADEAELLASLNATELARRRFREIARIAGLVFQSHPGERRSSRQLQASSSLYYDVFAQHDPGNALLAQARREALQAEVDVPRLHAVLARMQTQALHVTPLERASPLAFPLIVERLRERLSTETLAERVARMVAQLERHAD